MLEDKKIAVIIPCYRVKNKILNVISGIPDFVDFIVVVDDKCPESTGNFLLENLENKKVFVEIHESNQGVGGAVITGYKKAISLHADILVKVDGDGQMDPAIMINILKPILKGEADYSKGNRFFWPEGLVTMPLVRKIGNAGLSFFNKVSSGYWDIMDPTNGYTALSSKIVNHLNLNKVSKKYFFESDMLFRLGIIRAVVKDVPMNAFYDDEVSNLKVTNSLFTFSSNHFTRMLKRIIYLYFIRDFNQGSLSLLFSFPLLVFSVLFGSYKWIGALQTNISTPVGTLFLTALPFLAGFHLILSFLNYDVNNVPKDPLNSRF